MPNRSALDPDPTAGSVWRCAMTTGRSGAPPPVNHISVGRLLFDLEVQALQAWAWCGFGEVAGIVAP